MASIILQYTKVITDKSSDVTIALLKKPDTIDENINNEEWNLTIQSFPKVTRDAEKKPSDVERPLMKKPDTHDQNINNKEGNSRPKKNQFYFLSLVVVSIAIIIGVLILCIIHEKNTPENTLEHTPEKNLTEIDKIDIYLELWMVDNDIIFFTPPRRICFKIFRAGYYHLDLLIKPNSLFTFQSVFVTFKNQTLESPIFIINKTISESSFIVKKKISAEKNDQICLISDHHFNGYEGNFIIIQHFHDYL